MTRPALSINTTNTATHDTTIYSISQSPIIESKQSIESIRTVTVVGNDADTSKADLKSSQSTKPTQAPPTPRNLKPSVRLLFSQLSRKDTYLYLCPAIAVAMISGGIAPFMTVVLGESFDAFARFSTGSVSQAQKDALVRDVGINCIELAALAVGSFILGTSMSALWITTGERNVMMLRKRVYESVVRRNIEWFDTKIGSEDDADGDTTVGVGGMMASFAKDTEEVRMASSLASGTIVQSLTSCIVCLALAFSRSWSLTLLILAGVPVIVFTQTIAQRKAGAGLVFERKYNESAATLVDRAVSSIATVKAFNAEPDEVSSFSDLMDTSMDWGRRITGVWGISSGLVQFVSMTMFVQAFWFGAELVRSGSLSPGTVTAVFWACLIATTSLQKCLVPLVQLTKGKWAMIPLLSLIDPPAAPITPTPETKAHPHMVLTPITPAKSNLVHSPHFANKSLRGIRPSKCLGELALYDVEFAYPSRPDLLILKGASLFLPANDTTFIVGGSGSGKSTIAQLLAQMYYPQDGCISLDDQDMAYLDEDWTRQHVALVSQSCILFDMTVHENVAMGIAGSDKDRRPEDVSREEVIQVCTMALMHEFIRDLPNGYDTKLGTGGSSLSGGQKQRLAIARALLRDPTVLILDEATSALDVISRVLVFEAIRACRKGKTTIVITHDLSQIQSTDFVYVLKHGEVFEQGYRSDLELDTHGEFYEMSKTQKAIGGLPEKQTEPTQEEKIMHESERDALLEQIDVEREDESVARQNKHRSLGSALIPADGLDSLFEAFKDFSGSVEEKRSTISASIVRRSSSRSSKTGNKILSSTFPRRASLQQQRSSLDYPSLKSLPSKQSRKSRRSLQFTPLSPVYSVRPSSVHSIEDDEEIILEKLVMDQTGLEASRKRHGARLLERRTKWEDVSLDDVKVEKANVTDNNKSTPSLIRLAYQIFPTINNKPRFFISLLICIASGAMTPVFSYVLSRLTFEVSIGAQNVSTLNILGGLALAFTALDGLFLGLKYFLMELVGCRWLGNLRKKMYRVILAQDKKWFDKSENGPIELVQKFMKDGYEAQNILSMVLSQFLAVTAMMFTGLIWALIQSWQITLVGIGIAPIFAAAMSLQSNLVGRVEGENKIAREEVAKVYYNSIANIRAIRSMNFGSVFQQQFDSSVSRAHKSGLKGALFEGFTYGLASGLIYLAQAILFIVGAVLVARGTTSFQSMLAALNLIVFSISIGSQMMVFTRRISVSANACHDLFTLMDSSKSTDTDESRGSLKPALSGSIRLQDVYFSYPERPDVPVLQGASLRLSSNECVAVVGSSGSGKSTIALLLQRLYNPDSGSILLDETPLGAIDVHHLRQQISVVSQNPHLFDASISKNIAFGSQLSQAEIEEAAKKANVHDFIASLPNGYDTKVGENATLISGGQAQRLQIARALARNCRVLILDECTSALDPANEAAVMDTIRSASNGRTTLMITHKLHTMQMCDRICLVHQGVIAEEGTYDALLKRNGIFAQLARGGEWTSSA